MNEVFLDTETTGLSIKDDHRIVELACIETKNLIPTKNIFYCLINPERDVSDDAFKIHGYSYDKLKKEKKFSEIADKFIQFISNKKIIIHNAPFDLGFLNHELKKVNINVLKEENNVIDTLALARSKFPGSSNSLDSLCKRFNIDLSERTKHNALIDCELLRKVYINLVGEKEQTLIFQDTKPSNFSLSNKISKNIKYFKKIVKPSDEEFDKHKKFLKSELKKNYF